MKNADQRVVIVQRILPHYRVGFFDALHSRLANCGVELVVAYGQQEPNTVPKTVVLQRSWSKFFKNKYFHVGAHSMVWQPVLSATRDADLVIIEHASRLLCNYPLHVRHALGRQRIAYWGHGKNSRSKHNTLFRDRFKNLLINHVDWWFAYTELSRQLIDCSGFPEENVSVVNNSIDTISLENALTGLTREKLEKARFRLGLKTRNVGLYCGGMYKEKSVEFLLAACHRVRSRINDFEMIFVGNGPDCLIIQDACEKYDWLHWVGPVFGVERAVYFALSRALLMPGRVGLVILDSFVSECPMFTTDLTVHSPEINYLENGVNGWMTEPDEDAYSQAIIDFLSDPDLEGKLREGCRQSASRYTLANMVTNFTDGIEKCLQQVKSV